ncbi:hypothetical protein FVE85_0198 [Porphyridium purpureum]|uniref:Uncharacterized protein n=1 Tax=Porphyridium purpureum TaxID=35688 RepID=A0A5J4YY01_PORPP|nr:hypothetical protein FVE85_0198 [Porphyridium purpureum]|eukprot:POR8190..scf208_2
MHAVFVGAWSARARALDGGPRSADACRCSVRCWRAPFMHLGTSRAWVLPGRRRRAPVWSAGKDEFEAHESEQVVDYQDARTSKAPVDNRVAEFDRTVDSAPAGSKDRSRHDDFFSDEDEEDEEEEEEEDPYAESWWTESGDDIAGDETSAQGENEMYDPAKPGPGTGQESTEYVYWSDTNEDDDSSSGAPGGYDGMKYGTGMRREERTFVHTSDSTDPDVIQERLQQLMQRIEREESVLHFELLRAAAASKKQLGDIQKQVSSEHVTADHDKDASAG